MTKVIGLNGSPRKDWNSAKLLESALQGAESVGAQTELIHLRDLQYTGCMSCFSCKKIDGSGFGRCALRDDLTAVLDKIMEADALIISMPIYCGDVPGMVRNLFERLWFAGSQYRKDGAISYTHREKVALFYAMNVPDESRYAPMFQHQKEQFEHYLGETTLYCATDTLQFDNYANYVGDQVDPAAKLERHNTQFPIDRQKAFEIGKKLTEK